MVLGLAAAAVDIFIETAGVAGLEIGDDEARVDAVGPASVRAMMRSTRLQLCAPSRNSL